MPEILQLLNILWMSYIKQCNIKIKLTLIKFRYEEGDARNVLTAFAEKEGETGVWVDSAYKKTQPVQIFDKRKPLEDEVNFYEQSGRKKCPACGLKFCTCDTTIFQLPIPKNSKKKEKNY